MVQVLPSLQGAVFGTPHPPPASQTSSVHGLPSLAHGAPAAEVACVQTPIVQTSSVHSTASDVHAVPSGLTAVTMQPVFGSMSLRSGSPMQLPAVQSVVQSESIGVLVHASVSGSQVSTVHEKPSLQIGAL